MKKSLIFAVFALFLGILVAIWASFTQESWVEQWEREHYGHR